jgi:hypothetical protein
MLIPDFGPGFSDADSVVRDLAGRMAKRGSVVVVNRTSRNLRFSAFDYDGSAFGVDAPSTAVPAGAASVFSLEVTGIFTGVEAWANYVISGCGGGTAVRLTTGVLSPRADRMSTWSRDAWPPVIAEGIRMTPQEPAAPPVGDSASHPRPAPLQPADRTEA